MGPSPTQAMWQSFVAATGARGAYDVFAFGDSPAMADELAHLVTTGRKRATAGLLAEYRAEGGTLPAAGDHAVMTGGDGAPLAVLRVTDVRVGPLLSVDDAFAWDEGEGDRSRGAWLADHRAFFARAGEMSDNPETVFQRFRVVWPPEWADP